MATTITQKPLYTTLPVGQDVIFTLTNTASVNAYFNVKFIAEVYISQTSPSTTTVDLIGTFKTTPNTALVGIFDFSAVVENHVKADNLATSALGISQYKTVPVTADRVPPIHLVDKFALNENAMKYLIIKFSMEGSTTATGIPAFITGSEAQSVTYKIFNGYLKETNKLEIGLLLTAPNDFGLNIGVGSDTNIQLTDSNSSFLSNAPTTQYANIDDYGTLGILCPIRIDDFTRVRFTYYDSTGSTLGNEDVFTYLTTSSNLWLHLLYVGCFPANLRGWSTIFQGLVTAGTIQGGYYTVEAKDVVSSLSQIYTIHVNCPDLKNYEPIRLCWLNQWGAWDYYTFTKKSSRTLSTQGTTYTQLEGTWNESAFRLNGYRGGKKAFRVNATEKIKMNTDFVNESESEWFEELINSPEVYMLEGFQTDNSFAMLNTYITPVRLTTSSYTRKTIANDRLMQYTFEVEKSKTLRTQAV